MRANILLTMGVILLLSGAASNVTIAGEPDWNPANQKSAAEIVS